MDRDGRPLEQEDALWDMALQMEADRFELFQEGLEAAAQEQAQGAQHQQVEVGIPDDLVHLMVEQGHWDPHQEDWDLIPEVREPPIQRGALEEAPQEPYIFPFEAPQLVQHEVLWEYREVGAPPRPLIPPIQNRVLVHPDQEALLLPEDPKPILFLEDFHLFGLPLTGDPRVQIVILPMFGLLEAARIISRTRGQRDNIDKVVLYFGFNDRDEPRSEVLKRDVWSLLEKTYEAFPRTHIFISWIGSNQSEPPLHKRSLAILNATIRLSPAMIPLPPHFQTEERSSKWTLDTGKRMEAHWLRAISEAH